MSAATSTPTDAASAPPSIEREIMLTGIGGQGVQLAARILALAATLEGREVMSLGTYGGTMRGGNTDATIVVAEGPITSPPLVSHAWAALVVHPRYFEPMRGKLRPEGIVVLDGDLLEGEPLETGSAPLPTGSITIPATTLAREANAPKAAALVLLGAFVASTGLVSAENLDAALEAALPPYRRESIESNRRALAAGREAVTPLAMPAWREEAA
jgi:Pyruvate/2-oxoacid:ferredoxin oxidoreductase gamma subunit